MYTTGRKHWNEVHVIILLGTLLTAGMLGATPGSEESEKICRTVFELIPRIHYARTPVNERIVELMLQSYIENLDKNRMIFLKSDLNEFYRRFTPEKDLIGTTSSLVASLQSGDLAVARFIYNRYKQRFYDQIKYVEKLLNEAPNFNIEEYWTPNRRQASWPRNLAEAGELWRLKIKFELLELIMSGLTQGESAKILLSDYRRQYESMRLDDGRMLRYYLTSLVQAYDPHSAYSIRGRSTAKLHNVLASAGTESTRISRAKLFFASSIDKQNHYAIINLPLFYSGCGQDILEILQRIREAKSDGVVLDLRGNRGGSIDEAVKTVGFFLGEKPIFHFKGQSGKVETLYAKGNQICELPMMVLVDSATSSAAEIVAGSLQDYRRALIAGSAYTFGKGTMQGIIPLARIQNGFSTDPGELKITIRQFYRLTGAPVQGRGVMSDITIPIVGDQFEIREKNLPRAIVADYIPGRVVGGAFYDSLPFTLLRERSSKRIAHSRAFDFANQLQLLSYRSSVLQSVPLRYEQRRWNYVESLRLKSELEKIAEVWNYSTSKGEKSNSFFRANDCRLEEALLVLNDYMTLSAGRRQHL